MKRKTLLRSATSMLIVGIVAAGVSCGTSDQRAARSTTSTSPPTAVTTTPRDTLDRTCPDGLGVGANIDCHDLVVPERRDDPHAAQIHVAYVILHAEHVPTKPPLVFLAGGPGAAAMPSVKDWIRSRFQRDRDVIFVDQRGTGESTPSLDCPETEAAIWALFADPAPTRAEQAQTQQAALECQHRVTGSGVDLAGYNSVESAQDFADLRATLRIDSWDVFGVSYGTGLAQQLMRLDPSGIRAVGLDAVQPVSVGVGGAALAERADSVMSRLYAACSDDVSCSQLYPDLEATFERATRQLDQAPARLTATDSKGQQHDIQITGHDFRAFMFFSFYDRTLIGAQPAIISHVADGDTALLPTFTARIVENFLGFDEAMGISVSCADRSFAESPGDFQRRTDTDDRYATLDALFPSPALCDAWGVPPIVDIAHEPVRSDIPTLLSAGEFDPITPPSDARLVAQGLSHVTVINPPATGHGSIPQSNCPAAIFAAFYEHPTLPPDTACIDAMPHTVWR